ncbi:dihydrofolate reductase family protein [Carboxylicivirga sp. M1479]|uniref:dihydrofolate reductase family protein n=1 Tax=Carboxylicivirga sp. M1479 TaxID=2594476 RepID=UPI001177F98E|nr:dihydrofolate reductase family protein [Carboxylicivirga sp. M1479]TRX66443.1 dihydrofolate reductase [Carboxylicivirga sp. M1479]
MEKRNKVFIATSLDGYIADKNGGLDWLHSIPNTDQVDMGYGAFMNEVDAIIMGRTTFETVCGFDCPWPYSKPVFVLSRTLKTIPEEYVGKVQLVNGSLSEVLKQVHGQDYHNLYIDGGNTIQSFLQEDLIDDLILTTIPVLLGGGSSLFGDLDQALNFELVSSSVFLDQVQQVRYKRTRK